MRRRRCRAPRIAWWTSVRSRSAWRRQRQRRGLGGMERDPAVGRRQRARTRPQHLAGGEQFVEHPRLVVAHPLAEDQRLHRRGRASAHRRAGRSPRRAHRRPTPRRRPACCHAGRKRPNAAVLTGSIWARSAASERRRRMRSTSASHHWSMPPESAGASMNSPRISLPSAASRPSTSAATRKPRPNRAAASAVVNGPRVRAYRDKQLAQRVDDRFQERHRHARPAPRRRRRRATGRCPRPPPTTICPANDTVSARLAVSSPSSQPPTSADRRSARRLPRGSAGRAGAAGRPRPRRRGRHAPASGAAAGARCRDHDVGVEQFAQFDPAQQFGQQGRDPKTVRRRGVRPAGCRPRT